MADVDATPGDASPSVPPRQLLALLLLAAAVGLVVSLASWCFLQLVHYMPQWVYEDLADAVGYEDGAPLWWYLPVCAFAGLVVAFAIVRLPGRGGHVPAHGLNAGRTEPIDLPGVMLAAVAASASASCSARRLRCWRWAAGSRSWGSGSCERTLPTRSSA